MKLRAKLMYRKRKTYVQSTACVKQRQTMTHKYANLWFWSHIATRSGHHIQLDQPDLVIAAIKQVLTGKV